MNLAKRLSFLLLFFSIIDGIAQTIAVDKSFGNNGRFFFSNGKYNEVKDIEITKDGSSLILIESGVMDTIRDMDVIVLKLTPKGAPDLEFGKSGHVVFDFCGMNISRAGELRILDNGKILIAGDGSNNEKPEYNLSCLAKLNSDGSIDTSFGKSGTVAIGFDKISYLTSVYVAKDNSIFIAGSYNQPVRSHTDIFPVIAKLHPNGEPDTTFGRTGKIRIDFNFEIFSFASVKHTAGGEIRDILIQDDGKILVCGGYIFAYSYEGFIARFLPDGKLDKTFNSKGYFRHDFTPGKFNLIKRMIFSDTHTLLFGASSQTDFDSDFYLGVMKLKDQSFSVYNLDCQGHHDIFEDLSIVEGEVMLTGRSVLPENASLRQQGNSISIIRIPEVKYPQKVESLIYPVSSTSQNGAMCHAIFQEKVITGGFVNTPNVFVKDVVIVRFTKKKAKQKSQK